MPQLQCIWPYNCCLSTYCVDHSSRSRKQLRTGYSSMGDWKVSELESARIHFLPILSKIGKCQNWKVSESESVRIGKCQNRKVSESESVRIGKCQKLLSLESVRIGKCQNLLGLESVRIGKCQKRLILESVRIGKCQKLLRLERVRNRQSTSPFVILTLSNQRRF